MSFDSAESLSINEIRQLNQGFLQAVKNGDESRKKLANTLNEEVILRILREDGIGRRLLPFKPVGPGDLSVDPKNPDVPVMFVPVEPILGEYLATAVDFMQPSKELWFRTSVAAVYFKPIKTKTISLHEAQLLASNFPIKSYIESIAKNDILAVEDIFLVNAIERCVAKHAGDGNNFLQAGPLTKDHLSEATKAMSRNRLGIVQIAINEITFADILKWSAQQVGSHVMEDIIDWGPKGEELKFKSWFGYRWVLTNNTDVIAENVLYYLPPQRYLGGAYMLADAEQWIEFRDGVLRTNTREIIGRNLFNARGPVKQRL